MSPDHLLQATVVLPFAGALVLLCLPRLEDRAAAWAGVATGLLTLGCAVAATVVTTIRGIGRTQLESRVDWVPSLGLSVHLGLDGVSAPLVLLTAALTVLVCGHLVRAVVPGGPVRLLVVCVLTVAGGAIGTFVALDLLLFFVAFETVLIPMWFVIGGWGDTGQRELARGRGAPRPGGQAARRDAATRFVLFTAAGSAVMLLGIILVVARTGTSDLTELIERGGAGMSGRTQTVAAVLIVLGLAVKAPIWPLHTWLPPAHTIAPTAGSVLLAGVALKLGTYGLVRVAVPVLPAGMQNIAPWLGGFGALGIVWAGLVCLAERDLKRLVAQSSVAHMGFVLLGVASMTPTGLQGALFGNVAHGVVSALLFFVVGGLKDRFHSADLADLGSGLRDRLPRLGWFLTFGALAGLGLPGLAVFWGELLAITGAWGSSALGLTARPLAVLAALGTAIAAAYWLRVLRMLWQGAMSSQPAVVPDATTVESATVVPLVLATVALGLVPGPLLAATAGVVRQLLPGAGVVP